MKEIDIPPYKREKKIDDREITHVKQKEIRGNGKKRRFTSINNPSIGVELRF